MLTVEPLAYARARQAELRNAADQARLARLARSCSCPETTDRAPWLGALTSRLKLRPAAPAACSC